jgi:hypothetical protein
MVEFALNKNNIQFVQFVLEVEILEYSFVKHSQGNLGVKVQLVADVTRLITVSIFLSTNRSHISTREWAITLG